MLKVSSAHVYLRLQPNQTLDDIPASLIDDCAQLVKANSISGNKLNNIEIVYTMWTNLKKTGDMDVGQVGFKCNRDVRKVRVERRCNEIVNRLTKTKRQCQLDFRAEREDRDRRERDEQKARLREQRIADAAETERRERERKQVGYESMMIADNMQTNRDDGNDSDEFM